jgi:hypothetical protein
VEEYASQKRNATTTANHDEKQYRKLKEPMLFKIKALIED